MLYTGSVCQAQQNLFNVPSTDITQKGQWFFQQQFNFLTASLGSSNTTLDYGLGHPLEIGLRDVSKSASFTPTLLMPIKVNGVLWQVQNIRYIK
jgi:hypothetical protein